MKKKLLDFKIAEVAKPYTTALKGGTGNNPAGPMNPNAPPAGGGGHE